MIDWFRMQMVMHEFVSIREIRIALLYSDMQRTNALPTPAAAFANEQ